MTKLNSLTMTDTVVDAADLMSRAISGFCEDLKSITARLVIEGNTDKLAVLEEVAMRLKDRMTPVLELLPKAGVQ
mgnify:FL=1